MDGSDNSFDESKMKSGSRNNGLLEQLNKAPYRACGASRYFCSANSIDSNPEFLSYLKRQLLYGLVLSDLTKMPLRQIEFIMLWHLNLDALFIFLDVTDPETIIEVINRFVWCHIRSIITMKYHFLSLGPLFKEELQAKGLDIYLLKEYSRYLVNRGLFSEEDENFDEVKKRNFIYIRLKSKVSDISKYTNLLLQFKTDVFYELIDIKFNIQLLSNTFQDFDKFLNDSQAFALGGGSPPVMQCNKLFLEQLLKKGIIRSLEDSLLVQDALPSLSVPVEEIGHRDNQTSEEYKSPEATIIDTKKPRKKRKKGSKNTKEVAGTNAADAKAEEEVAGTNDAKAEEEVAGTNADDANAEEEVAITNAAAAKAEEEDAVTAAADDAKAEEEVAVTNAAEAKAEEEVAGTNAADAKAEEEVAGTNADDAKAEEEVAVTDDAEAKAEEEVAGTNDAKAEEEVAGTDADAKAEEEEANRDQAGAQNDETPPGSESYGTNFFKDSKKKGDSPGSVTTEDPYSMAKELADLRETCLESFNRMNASVALIESDVRILRSENIEKQEQIDFLKRENTDNKEQIYFLKRENIDKQLKINILTKDNIQKQAGIDFLMVNARYVQHEINIRKGGITGEQAQIPS